MSHLVFSRLIDSLELFDAKGLRLGQWQAANNVASTSNGIWPDGRYDFDYWKDHPESGIDGAYGTKGIFIFKVHGRVGMGVHAGRKNVADGKKRKGPQHATLGCVRTTEEAMAKIKQTHDGGDKLTYIVLIEAMGDFPKPTVVYA